MSRHEYCCHRILAPPIADDAAATERRMADAAVARERRAITNADAPADNLLVAARARLSEADDCRSGPPGVAIMKNACVSSTGMNCS